MFKALSKFLVHQNRQLHDPESRLLMGLLSNEGNRKGRTVLQSRTCVIVTNSPNRTTRRKYTLSKETFVGQEEVQKSSPEENPDHDANAKYDNVQHKANRAKMHKESQSVRPGNKCGKKLRDANHRLAELEKTVERSIHELKQKQYNILQAMSKETKSISESGSKKNEEQKYLKRIRNYKDKNKNEENSETPQKQLGDEQNRNNGGFELNASDMKQGGVPDFHKYLASYPLTYGRIDQVANSCGCEYCSQHYLCRPYASANPAEAVLYPGSMCVKEEYRYRNYRQFGNDQCVQGRVWNCCCSSKKTNQISQSYNRCSTDLQTEQFYQHGSKPPSAGREKNIKHVANFQSQGDPNRGGQKVNKRIIKGVNGGLKSKSSSPERNTDVKHQQDFQNKKKAHTEPRSYSEEYKSTKEHEMVVKDKPRKGESENVLSRKERKSGVSNGVTRNDSAERYRPSRKTRATVLDATAVQSSRKERDNGVTFRNGKTLVDFCHSPREHMPDIFIAPSTSNGQQKYSTATTQEFQKMRIREYAAVPLSDKQRDEKHQIPEEKAKRYLEYINQYKNRMQNYGGTVHPDNSNSRRYIQSDNDETGEELYAYGPNFAGWDAYQDYGKHGSLNIEYDIRQANKLNIKPQARDDIGTLRSLSTGKSAKADSPIRNRMAYRPQNRKSDFKQDKEQTYQTNPVASHSPSPLYSDNQKYRTFRDRNVEASKAIQRNEHNDIYETSDATESPRSARSQRNNNAIDATRMYSNLQHSDKNAARSISQQIKSRTTYVLSSCSQETPKERAEYLMEQRKQGPLQKPQSHIGTKPKTMMYTSSKGKATKQSQESSDNKLNPRSYKEPSTSKNVDSKSRRSSRSESYSPRTKTATTYDESSSLAHTVQYIGELLKCYRKGLVEDEHLKTLAEEVYANFSSNSISKRNLQSCENACQEKRTIEIQCKKQEKSEHCQTEDQNEITESRGSNTLHQDQFPDRILENSNDIADAEYWSNEKLIAETRKLSNKENDLTTGSLVAKPISDEKDITIGSLVEKPNSATTSQFEAQAPQTSNAMPTLYLLSEVPSKPNLDQSFEGPTSSNKPHGTTTDIEVSRNTAYNGLEQYKAPFSMEHNLQQFVSKDILQQQPVDPQQTELPKNAKPLNEEFSTHSRLLNYNLKDNLETLSAFNENNFKLDVDPHEGNTSTNACSTILMPLNTPPSNYECRYEIVDDGANNVTSKGILINCCPSDAYDNEESLNISREVLDNDAFSQTIESCTFEIEDEYFDDDGLLSCCAEYQDAANIDDGNYDSALDEGVENSKYPSDNHIPLEDPNINRQLKRPPTFRNCPCMFDTFANMMKIYNRHQHSPRFAES